MSNLVMWNLIVGFLMPNLVAVLQQPKFSSQVRTAITAVASVVGGFGTAYFLGQFNLADVVGSVLVTGVAAITFYKGFWKPTGVATAIENATSPGAQPAAELAHPDDAPRHARDEFGRADTGTIAMLALAIAVVAILIILL